MKDRLRDDLTALMRIPGLSGHEDRVRRHIAGLLRSEGIESRSDRLGNLIATFEGDPETIADTIQSFILENDAAAKIGEHT